MKYEWNEVLENRKKWLEFLRVPGRRKVKGFLDIGNGQRCCLGHACKALGMKWEGEKHYDVTTHPYEGNIPRSFLTFFYDNEETEAPQKVIDSLGLRDSYGGLSETVMLNEYPIADLVTLNDDTNLRPREIADFIEKHYDLVFRSQSEYGAA